MSLNLPVTSYQLPVIYHLSFTVASRRPLIIDNLLKIENCELKIGAGGDS